MPLTKASGIEARLDEVDFFFNDASLRRMLRQALAGMPDVERALGRLTVGRGGPRDLAAIQLGLTCGRTIGQLLAADQSLGGLPLNVAAARETLATADQVLMPLLQAALADELPLLARDGGFVRAGYSTTLDDNRALRDATRQVIADLQVKYADLAGIKSLKIRHNNVLGYFIEVTSSNAGVLQAAELAGTFIHRQTVASAVRFVTTELAALEERIAAAADRAIAIEQEIFAELVAAVSARRSILAGIAEAVSAIDVSAGLAELATQRRYVRPKVDDSQSFDIRAGRHAVVEAMLKDRAETAFACGCSPDPIWPASRRSCARTPSSSFWRRWAPSCRRIRPMPASSTGCSAGSVRPTIWPGDARLSWSRWWRRRRF